MNPNYKIERSPSLTAILVACALLLVSASNAFSQNRSRGLQNPTSGDPVSKILLLQIMRAEDERRWDDDVRSLFSARNAAVRSRAALAAGRIGDEQAVESLITLLQRDDEPEVRAMAAFALGEIEAASGAKALIETLKDTKQDAALRARAVEALGKIAAALPKEQEALSRELGGAILDALSFEAGRTAPDDLSILLGLTATLRVKPPNAGPLVAKFLHYSDWRIRADAANTLARLRLKDGNDELRKLLTSDPDPIVRANAARVLGATEDKTAFDALLDRARKDKDSRVRVSSIRALAALKDARAAQQWLSDAGGKLANKQRPAHAMDGLDVTDWDANETLEIATAIGRILQDTEDEAALKWLHKASERFSNSAPEIEIALVRISPGTSLPIGDRKAAEREAQKALLLNWRAGSALAQALGEIAALPDTHKDKKRLSGEAEQFLRAMLDYRNSGLTINTLVAVHSEYAIPDVLRAFAAFKPTDLNEVLRRHLKETDVIVRGTAADLLGELPPEEANTQALIEALPLALGDKDNDAALSILDALAKQKNPGANEAIKTGLESPDHLVRRRAVALLKAGNAGDFSSRIGRVRTRNTTADYERALARIGKQINASISTTKGSFTIRLLPDDAPLNVDNFVQLAKRKYFNGITVHRVVPNFVIQDGDPRGDGNGGPGYSIRCEINLAPYERAAVGMALSGKDTGGSQWFVTHSRQPHLDGGYTVFGNVIEGMNVVDSITRGDVIRSIVINENPRLVSARAH